MSHYNFGKILLAALLLISVVCVPSPVYAQGWLWDTPDSQTWYQQSYTQTVNTQLGYAFDEAAGEAHTSVTIDWVGEKYVRFRWQIYLLERDGNTTSLGNISVTRTTNGSGIQSVNWTPSNNITINYSYHALKFVLQIGYWQVPIYIYTDAAIFVTDLLETSLIYDFAWTFYTYTERIYNGFDTKGTVYFGDLTYQTRIENVQMKQLSPWEKQMMALNQGHFAMFIVLPWTNLIGNLFYGLLLFFVCITTYLRYDDIRVVLLWFWIFGGTGGVATLMIPALGLHLAWLFLALALAVTFYLVVT